VRIATARRMDEHAMLDGRSRRRAHSMLSTIIFVAPA